MQKVFIDEGLLFLFFTSLIRHGYESPGCSGFTAIGSNQPGRTQSDRTVLMWLSSVGACPVSQWLAERQASPLAPWMFGRICRGGGAQVFEPYDASMLQLAWTMAVAPPRETPADWLLYKGAGEVAKILADQLGSDVRLNAPVSHIRQGSDGLTI